MLNTLTKDQSCVSEAPMYLFPLFDNYPTLHCYSLSASTFEGVSSLLTAAVSVSEGVFS